MFEALLRIPSVRNRLAFELRQKHYSALKVAAPLGNGLVCPIVRPDYWSSFEEIFLRDEYRPVFELLEPPGRWIDLGCHAGIFSLLVVVMRRRRRVNGGFEALLVDGDSRVEESITAICEENRLEGQLQFLHGAIAANAGELTFNEAEFMSSALAGNGEARGTRRTVRVARPEQLMERLAPPYDLVKVDIEGAEHDFLTSYGEILSQTRHLLLEWHSWHFGGGGLPSIREATRGAGFREVAEIAASHACGPKDSRTCGVILFENAA